MPAPSTRLAVCALVLLVAVLTCGVTMAMTGASGSPGARASAGRTPGVAIPTAPTTGTPTTGTPSAGTPSAGTPTTSLADTSPVVVVGLGDSVTSGFACDCATFIDLYAAMLRQRAGRPTEAVN